MLKLLFYPVKEKKNRNEGRKYNTTSATKKMKMGGKKMLLVGYIEFILFIRLNQKKKTKKSFKEAYTEMSDFRFFFFWDV